MVEEVVLLKKLLKKSKDTSTFSRRGRFVSGRFREGTFFKGTLCWGDVFSRGRFVKGTFCQGDVSWRGRFVWALIYGTGNKQFLGLYSFLFGFVSGSSFIPDTDPDSDSWFWINRYLIFQKYLQKIELHLKNKTQIDVLCFFNNKNFRIGWINV